MTQTTTDKINSVAYDKNVGEGNIVKPLHGAIRTDLGIRQLRGEGWRLILELIEKADLTYAEQYNIALALDCKEYMLDPDKGFGAPLLSEYSEYNFEHTS